MSLALHFMTGKQKGQEFPVPDNKDVVMGRGRDEEILLDSPAPQIKQAILSSVDGKVFIRDLHSGVETSVNGRAVAEAELHEGDRIRVGPVSMMVVALTRFSPAVHGAGGGTQFILKSKGQAKAGGTAGGALSGSLSEVSLTDVLQFVTQSRKDGVVRLSLASGTGKIHVRDGRIVYASWEGQGAVGPLRILFRLLRQKSGTFEFGPPEERIITAEIDASADALLLSGIQEADEIAALLPKLPPLGSCVEPARTEGTVRLRDLSPEELDVLEIVLGRPTVQSVLDRHPRSDLEAMRQLIRLMECGLVSLSPGEASAGEMPPGTGR